MSLITQPRYLTENDMQRIHAASLEILSKKGIVFESAAARDVFVKNGAKADGNIIYIPSELVERSLKQLPQTFKLTAVNPDRSVVVGEGLAIHPAGGEVFVRTHAGERREGTLKDYSDLQKIYQYCDNIDMTGYQPVTPQDVPDRLNGLLCAREAFVYTDKPWLAPMAYVGRKEKAEILHLYDIVFGADFVRNNYVTWNVVCPESPLRYCEYACESIMVFSEYNQPTVLVSAPMSGISSPIFPLSTILLSNAETLAGICLSQLVSPGVPVLPSASLTFANMKTASWECACPDTALMLAGAIQMYKEFYHLPARAQTGVTSSKCIDYQAGFETMQSLLLTALMGVNVTSQSAGTLENLLTVSLEKTVIDDEVIARVRRLAGGFDTSDESLALDAIFEVEHGRDYLTHDTTLDHFSEGFRESISDWNTFEQWSAKPDREITDRAHQKVCEILEEAQPLLGRDEIKAIDDYIASV
ncbi:MAG: hypothetical protein HFJ85_02505 [Oscillospiraceae bacterium]|nr:hypothetical protein [Oscillospiraceae bacterium]